MIYRYCNIPHVYKKLCTEIKRAQSFEAQIFTYLSEIFITMFLIIIFSTVTERMKSFLRLIKVFECRSFQSKYRSNISQILITLEAFMYNAL